MSLIDIEETKENSSHLLPDQIKYVIIHHKKLGVSNKKTALIVGKEFDRPSLHPQTVKSVWEKYLETGEIANDWNTEGRPKAINEKESKRFQSFLKRNPRKSISEAKFTLKLSACRSALNKHALELGLGAYRAPTKIKISENNISLRLDYAIDMEDLENSYWNQYIFSDESSFSLYNSNGRTYVRRTVGGKFG